MSGVDISQDELQVCSQITSIEKDGFWLLTEDGEFFVPFSLYPAFKNATLNQIYNFRESHGDFHWDELDIDIELDALKFPERYPLQYE
ncbi:MAG: DUF2442 domain-containing protein [Anaerolineales bacterium]|nr:DUF2442 domain-containing protein [Anaerolineales bacterium]